MGGKPVCTGSDPAAARSQTSAGIDHVFHCHSSFIAMFSVLAWMFTCSVWICMVFLLEASFPWCHQCVVLPAGDMFSQFHREFRPCPPHHQITLFSC